MRALLLTLSCLAASAAMAQIGSGTYSAPGSPAQPWQVNSHHTLIWNSSPYLPVGIRIDGSASEVAAAKAVGFQDAIVNLPANGSGWTEAIKALEAGGMRYLIAINSLAPMAEGVAVEPAGYRVSGISKAQRLQVRLPGASSALVLLVNRRDGSVALSSRQPVLESILSLDMKPYAEQEHVLLIYPRMRSLEQIDLWESLDEHRDRLLKTLRTSPPGPGLRGILNPWGRTSESSSSDPKFVPTSPMFRLEFADYLKSKYKNLETAMKSWSMTTSDVDSFEKLARLAPLWSGTSRGVSQLWDTDSDKLYTCNSARSMIWGDIEEVVARAASRRQQRFASAIQGVCNVPLVQEWSGWNSIAEAQNPAVDGIGMRPYGTTPSAILETASRAASSVLRWRNSGWLLATSIELGNDSASSQVANVLDDLTSLGARGWFVRSSAPEVTKAFAAQIGRSGDSAPSQYSPVALFFPENAANPAAPQLLPGGRWWLPSPAKGNRLDFGSHVYGYRYNDGAQSFTAIWTSEPTARVKLRMLDTKSPIFTSLDGTPPLPKVVKGGVEVTLGQTPLLVSGTEEIPIPETAYAETLFRMDRLFALADSLLIDVTEPRYLFKDALTGFERSPGGSFTIMRQQFDRVGLRLAKYAWVEAESSRNNNFSEVLRSPACSGGAALSLKTQIASPGGGYFAEYTVGVKSTDDVDIWVAARIPEDQRDQLKLTIAGQTFAISSDPVSLYGAGFGWYRLGTTRLAGASTKMRIQVEGTTADIGLDAIVLYPGEWRPRGVSLPDPIDFPPMKKGK